MKSRTSSFKTALRKNMTRFAPAWGLYTILLVMVLLTVVSLDNDYWTVRNMADFLTAMPVFGLFYALLTAQLLFGDLFNSRMCNALHAMPLRREGWFGANVAAGVLFNLIPTLVATLLSLPFCIAAGVIDGWQVPLYWLLGSNLSYLCFFGIAALCVQLTGNRFAMAVVYGILNFGAIITYWLVDTIYTPMFYGVRTWEAPFLRLTPVVHMAQENYVVVTRYNADTIQEYADMALTGEWYRLAIWAGVGIVLLGLALLLYRKRHLECAGDFMAFRKMEPAFLLVYTLIAGTCFQFFTSNVIGGYGDLIYLFFGLAVGWFTGRMLLKRTIRVFQWKAVGGCALLMVAMGVSLVVCATDLPGIASWMPEAGQVKTAYLYLGNASNHRIPESAAVMESPQDIDLTLQIHEMSLVPEVVVTDRVIATAADIDGEYTYTYADTYFSYTIIYELENGRTVYRYYRAYAAGEMGQLLTPVFSRPEVVLGMPEAALDAYADTVFEVTADGWPLDLTDAQIRSLLDAIVADCKAGNMVQTRSFHCLDHTSRERFYIDFSSYGEDRLHFYLSVNVWSCCENTLRWMDENDMWDKMVEYEEKYG